MDTTEGFIEKLIKAGFDVTIRKVKDGYRVEANNFDPDERATAHGTGERINDALYFAWQDTGIEDCETD